jgi:hypothetical protein
LIPIKEVDMKRFILSVLFILSFCGIAKAESSASSFDSTFRSQQVFIEANANATLSTPISKNDVVILDVTTGTVANKGLGAYIVKSIVTDSVYVLGVADEDISTGTLGRICVKGPHKVTMQSLSNSGAAVAAGLLVGNGNKAGQASVRTTADGTAVGVLGVVLSATPSTDTGDTLTQWIWVDTQRHQ